MTLRSLILRGILVVIACIFFYYVWLCANIWWWIDHNPQTTAFMDTQREVLQDKNPEAELKHRWVDYKNISPNIKKALIASEDAKFLAHEGFDWEGIQDAWEKNLKKGKIVAGGSTISQQLAKNLFLSSKKTPWRKLEEATITVMMENMMSKKRIFEIYINVIEWGNGVFGVEAAARHYYKKSARYLTAAEAAKLAAMVPNPRYYDKNRSDRKLLRKARIIQRRMYYADYP
ncbi:MAG: monofunctional biosynthetic peptidoglycan transglycosylase [Pseudomonadales bacterium]|nr:monofunctional biosynthetic peptidoglycan transglycosylase [Pseudomonadales bacterium]